MIVFKQKGSFKNLENILNIRIDYMRVLESYAKEGVLALSSATPIDSGETATSWSYEIKRFKNSCSIYWTNTHFAGDVPVAILLQYGHGTRNGGYVQGRDFINPAIRPIFDKMAESAWREVIK